VSNVVEPSTTGSDPLAAQVKHWLNLLDHSGRAVAPGSSLDLLHSVVEAAARIFHAAAASICLVTDDNASLEFMVAYGEGNQDVVGKRIPIDHGIAGYVLMTGQPVAISDVKQDPRFNQDFAQETGYVPRSILAMPLEWQERTLGVMEVLDKIDSPAFGLEDMELLGLFARQASIAITQSAHLERVTSLLKDGLTELVNDDDGAEFSEILANVMAARELTLKQTQLLAVTDCIHELLNRGEREQALCVQILGSLAAYLRSSPGIR
jgi:GAF domain-containing protein